MTTELLFPTETFFADVAREGEIMKVNFRMNVQAGFLCERFVANPAKERTLLRVGALVVISSCGRSEFFVAKFAGVVFVMFVNVVNVADQSTVV